MGAKGNAFITDLLNYLFNNTSIAALSSNLYASLHTADPGASGNQQTSEATYGGYARVAVARSSGGWTVSGQSVSPASAITFPAAVSGSETETYMCIGTAASGTGEILYRVTLSPTIAVANGVTPIVTTSTTVTEA